jgi:large subunit ribosomal protein L2
MPLYNIPLNISIHNIETIYNKGSTLIRSAGNFAYIIKKDSDINGFAYIKLNNKRIKKISLMCNATIGKLSNQYHDLYNYKKAGRIRNLNIRPTVRGVAMNPIDHPLGGGEGKTSGGRVSVTPWGRITKGKKTVKIKNHE